MANTYSNFGRVFRVERIGADRYWWAVGRSRGLRPMWLDRLGCRKEKGDMQATLDSWAQSRGLKPIEQTKKEHEA
jgi:hypothetical protein